MDKYLRTLLIGGGLMIGNQARAVGSINGLGEIVVMVIIATGVILLLLAFFISLLLNFLIFKGQRNVLGTAIGAFALSLIPTLIHGFGDYTMGLFITVLACGLLGGFLGYFLSRRIKGNQ